MGRGAAMALRRAEKRLCPEHSLCDTVLVRPSLGLADPLLHQSVVRREATRAGSTWSVVYTDFFSSLAPMFGARAFLFSTTDGSQFLTTSSAIARGKDAPDRNV